MVNQVLQELNTQEASQYLGDRSLRPPSREDSIFRSANNPFAYNNHNESIFDDYRYFPSLRKDTESVVKFDDENESYLNHATLKALIVQLTSPEVIDYNLICDFFLTFRMFTNANCVMNLLLTRLIWSLQYMQSPNQEIHHIGKLVLLRTFVVLRHWILNYFIDDFETDPYLGDVFATFINKLVQESQLIHEDNVFENKIICDLKTHWLNQLDEFYKIGFNVSEKPVFNCPLPLMSELSKFKRMPKSSTDASIKTNPSFRRSAMLSMYDLKTHHKCLIYDESIDNKENPQLSITNLLAQHKSSRTSLNDRLCEFRGNNGKKVLRKPLAPSNNQNVMKHNYRNLTDSSLALKKTAYPAPNIQDTNTHKTLEPAPQVPEGFSTNGHVKLPSLKVTGIMPSTPVKKMDITLKEQNMGSPSRKASHSPVLSSDLDDMDRKKSIKKLVDGWKKSFNTPDAKQQLSNLTSSTSLAHSLSRESKVRHLSSSQIGDRIDVLSARIIDELEYLISYCISEQKDFISENDDRDDISGSEIEMGNPETDEFVEVPADGDDATESLNSYDRSEAEIANTSTEQNDEMSMQELPDLSIDRIDNLFYKNDYDYTQKREAEKSSVLETQPEKFVHEDQLKHSSFGRVTSINWNDAGGLNFENSEQLDESLSNDESFKEDALRAERIIKSSTQYFDVSSEQHNLQTQEDCNQQNSSTSFSTPSDLDDYKANVVDLGLATSPQLLKRSVTFRKNSTHEQLSLNFAKRLSLASGASGSVKSYVSYDSAFSLSPSHEYHPLENRNLKKKSGHHDLRKLAQRRSSIQQYSHSEDVAPTLSNPMILRSFLSQFSASTQRKSIRKSTLMALTELPFNDRPSSQASSLQQDSQSRSGRLSAFGERSIFSLSGRSMDRDRKSGNQTSNYATSSNSVAIPGISSYVLKELAAIPDESFSSSNPIQSALSRLEGKGRFLNKQLESEKSKLAITPSAPHEEEEANNTNDQDVSELPEPERDVIAQENQENEEEVNPNNTEDILDEINNAATEDVIDYSSDVEKELQEKPLTPIMTKVRSAIQLSRSTPTFNGFINSNSNTNESNSPFMMMAPRAVLEKYSLPVGNLSIEKVIAEGTHISFVLNYSSRALAEHFTVIEKDMLQDVDWKELIELKWNKELTPVNSWLEIIVNENYFIENRGVNLVIARFNITVNWVISEILLTSRLPERIAIISRFIHIAHHCLTLQNFSTLMQIVLALTSEKVSKLKETWKNLPPGDILTLKNLEDLTSPFKNFINIRLCINQIKPSNGCIPFVGLYLSDLIFNAERPKYVKKPTVQKTSEDKLAAVQPPNMNGANDSSDRSITVGDSTEGLEGVVGDNDKLINFSRFRTSVHIVKSLSQSIEWSRHYNFAIEDEMLRKCLYLKSLDEEEMNFCLQVDREGTGTLE